jgi:hypothetical protein
MANFIEKHNTLRLIVRMTLIPLTGISGVALKLGVLPAISLLLLFGIGLIGLTTVRRRNST